MKGLAKLAPGPGNVALAERDEPSPGPGETLLEVVGAGVCGTDLHIFDDEFRSLPPVTMGHEVSAVVAAVGAGVDEDWLGARVVSETYYSTCNECEWCRAGRANRRARHIYRRSNRGFDQHFRAADCSADCSADRRNNRRSDCHAASWNSRWAAHRAGASVRVEVDRYC